MKFGRFAGALIVEVNQEFYLIGHTKKPCNYETYGFRQPEERDAASKMIRLTPIQLDKVSWPEEGSILHANVDLEQSLQTLAEVFLIKRNNMVSERIWDLVTVEAGRGGPDENAQWLFDMPEILWDLIRDTVLRC